MGFIGTSGDVYCCCEGWVKEASGNLKEQSILEIWNGPHYRKMREHHLEGRWEEVCNPVCPYVSRYKATKETIDLNKLQRFNYITPLKESEILTGNTVLTSTPSAFIFSNSGICNLRCIMCGWKDAKENSELLNKAYHEFWPLLPDVRELILTGGGDPFARPDTRAILLGESFENLKIGLITNGLLLPRYWDRIMHHKFSFIIVSIDAATKETYEKIRQNGKWELVLDALNLLKQNRNKFPRITLSMTVMKENYKEIPLFVEMAKEYGFNSDLARVRQYGDLEPSSNFFDNDKEILNDFIEVLRRLDPEDIGKTVTLSNLIEYYSP
jgi:sulfatase maturation enzyme AslB (radical SAM superfamily)